MKLSEQWHKNLKRSYFRGEQPDYSEGLSLFKDIKFYSVNPLYAIFYAGKNGIVSEYKLKEKVNIFNAKSNTDFYKLHKYVNENSLDIPFKTLEDLKKEDWIYVLGNNDKRETLLGIIKFLGYDGFFNYEFSKGFVEHLHTKFTNCRNEPHTSNNPAIGIFDDKDAFIHINDYYSIEQLCKFESVLDFKEDEIEKLKAEFRGNRYNCGIDEAYKMTYDNLDLFILSQEEAVDILNELRREPWSKKEEMIKWYNIFKSGSRPGFKEVAEKLEKELKLLD